MTKDEFDAIVALHKSYDTESDFVRIYTEDSMHPFLFPTDRFKGALKLYEMIGGVIFPFQYDCNSVEYEAYIPVSSMVAIEFGKNPKYYNQ